MNFFYIFLLGDLQQALPYRAMNVLSAYSNYLRHQTSYNIMVKPPHAIQKPTTPSNVAVATPAPEP